MPKDTVRIRDVLAVLAAAGALTVSGAATLSAESPTAIAVTGTELQRQTAARPDPGRKILVSLEQRRLWVVQNQDTIFTAPVAIGKGGVFHFADRTYQFDTPRGQRRILAKLDDPSWIPPDWHYFEKAVDRGLEPVHLEDDDMIELSDGTFIQVRDGEVGRINRWGNWFPFTPGSEIIFDGKIFIPPMESPQRRIPNALGPVKLSMGNGYLIHGTHRYNRESIGDAASHGCIRMRNEDVEALRDLVAIGTTVTIF